MVDLMECEKANQEAITRIQKSLVHLVRIGQARYEIKELKDSGNHKALLHAGPPVAYRDMCSAMKNAIFGAIIYEGWAKNLHQAEVLANSGEIEYYSCNELGVVGPMSGVVSPSMPLYVFQNMTYGNYSRVTFNEGLGKTLSFGANDDSVIIRLKWIEKKLAPIMAATILLMGSVDVTTILARGIQMGDEAHNRNTVCTGFFIRELAPNMVRTNFAKEDIADVLAFLNGNDQTFLNISMGISKAIMDTIIGVSNCSLVSCLCSNGYEFGLRVAGCGTKWFTAPSPMAMGHYFEGRSEKDASPVIGDSYILEATGLGTFALGCAFKVGQFIGITAKEALEYSERMYQITIAKHERFLIPALNFRGTPLGIEIHKVLERQELPIINSGIAHKLPGVGQIGVGIVFPPLKCFEKAVVEFAKMK